MKPAIPAKLILPGRAKREQHAVRLDAMAAALVAQASHLTDQVEARDKATAEGAGFAGNADTAEAWKATTVRVAREARECLRNAEAMRAGARALRLARLGADN